MMTFNQAKLDVIKAIVEAVDNGTIKEEQALTTIQVVTNLKGVEEINVKDSTVFTAKKNNIRDITVKIDSSLVMEEMKKVFADLEKRYAFNY